MACNGTLGSFPCCFIGIPFNKVRNRHHLSSPSNHLLEQSTLVALVALAEAMLKFGWGDDPTRKWCTKCTRLHYEDFGIPKVLISLESDSCIASMANLLAEYVPRAGRAMKLFACNVPSVKGWKDIGKRNIPSTTANQNDVTGASCMHDWETGLDSAKRSVEIDLHLIMNFALTATIGN